jgi:hypothetical protein
VPLLIDWLPQIENQYVKASIVDALRIKRHRRNTVPILLDEFERLPAELNDSDLKWRLNISSCTHGIMAVMLDQSCAKNTAMQRGITMDVSERFSKLKTIIKDRDCDSKISPAFEEQIKSAETELGVAFSGSYKMFLREIGAAFWPDYMIGLSDHPSVDVVGITLEERRIMRPAMPWNLIPILNDGYGNHYCLDTSVSKDGECPVVFWNHERPANQTPEFVADAYIDWLESKVSEQLIADA